MRVTLIRFNASLQASSMRGVRTNFSWIQLLTSGWEQGSRNRTKCFGTFSAAYRYLNKLSAGGYLSDEYYCEAWDALLSLESELEGVDSATFVVPLTVDDEPAVMKIVTKDPRSAAWESFPYSFK